MAASTRESFEGFVASRGGTLWRLAWLLTGDAHRAEDLVETALAAAWPRWSELERDVLGVEAGALRELVAAYLSRPPGTPVSPVDPDDDVRAQLLGVLATLTPQQRAALVLCRCEGVAAWDAADALDHSTQELTRLERDGLRAANRHSARADELLAEMSEAVPAPPYAADRSQRARARAGRRRRRRATWSVGAALLVLALLAVPALLGEKAGQREGVTSDQQPLPLAERLVDQLPIPDRCASVPDVPRVPAYPFDPDGASAVWMRFCPADDLDGSLHALPFAPDDTVVAPEVDRLLDSWTSSADGLDFCDFSAYSQRGLVRLQMGTLDGVLHVVDLRVGPCGRVTIDRQPARIDGRSAFADVVGLLGRERLADIDAPGLLPGRGRTAVASCPSSVEEIADLERTTVPDYPQVRGLPLPLPASSGLVCRYPARPGTAPAGAGRVALLDGEGAEWLRAAYLVAHAGTAEEWVGYSPQWGERPGCAGGGVATARYGVLVTDPTGSRRAFAVDAGRCAAGRWLSEVLRAAARGTAG